MSDPGDYAIKVVVTRLIIAAVFIVACIVYLYIGD